MWSSENLDFLNRDGLGIFIASNHFLAIGCHWHTGHGTVQCPVCATLAARWGLERLTVEVFCLLAAPDSLVAHQTCPVRSDFAAITSNFCNVRFYCSHNRPLSAGDRCSVGSPDMSGVHQVVPWIIAEWLPEKPESGQFGRCSAWAPDSVRCATGSTVASLCSKLGWVPNLISFLVYVEPYAPEINDN
jgi:hypothetical protein